MVGESRLGSICGRSVTASNHAAPSVDTGACSGADLGLRAEEDQLLKGPEGSGGK